MKINQANTFYNYTIGFGSKDVDLLKTASNLLQSGITRTAFFSDYTVVYLDGSQKLQIERITPTGRKRDSIWGIEMPNALSEQVASELLHAFQISFHETHCVGPNTPEMPPYIRCQLPPVMIDDGEISFPIYVSVKIFSNGIAILSFQYDATWDGVDDTDFVARVANLPLVYFEMVWVDARIQEIDAKESIKAEYDSKMFMANRELNNRRIKKIKKKMADEQWQLVKEALDEGGESFLIGDEWWELHRAIGSNKDENAELTVDLCRDEYTRALSSLMASASKKENSIFGEYIWQGRPSISLMRFDDQPSTKESLVKIFSDPLSKIMMRSPVTSGKIGLPEDLRPFEDYALYGNRAILLWIWLKRPDDSIDAWQERETAAMILENQARAEHVEFHNMKALRACSWAASPLSSDHLLHAYQTLMLTSYRNHHSSHAGEITDALTSLMGQFGTMELIDSAKEAASWRLEELKYQSDKTRSQIDRLLAFLFGVVGTAGVSDYLVEPYVTTLWPKFDGLLAPSLSFLISGAIVGGAGVVVWLLVGGIDE